MLIQYEASITHMSKMIIYGHRDLRAWDWYRGHGFDAGRPPTLNFEFERGNFEK